jgi:ABC-type proline/glycine betaine transport system ATPase subunit
VKLAQGNVFTNHDFEEALSLTRRLASWASAVSA